MVELDVGTVESKGLQELTDLVLPPPPSSTAAAGSHWHGADPTGLARPNFGIWLGGGEVC